MFPLPRTRPRRHGLAVGLATLVTIGLAAAGAPATASAAPSPVRHGDDGINGYRSIGYFPGWAPTGEADYQVADLVRTGAIADLTHLNYAFGNVTTDLVCDITDAEVPDDGVDPGEPEGDPESDYLHLVDADDAVDGVADRPGQALAGNFNQLRKLKAVAPDLKVLISIGGWTWSDNFSDAVATPEGRERLVESCVDLYLRGNLPVRGDQGGEGVAAGIFDGIDIDWEWPAADGEHPSPRPDEDKENFLAFMELLRASMDRLGAETGEDYLLTGFAPAGWAPRTNGGWTDPRLASVVDFLNVQGYDYHGTWVADRTGHQGNLHKYRWPDSGDDWANWGLAADDLLAAYRAAGYDGSQVNLGLAAYGQGWSGVDDPTPGAPAGAAVGVRNYNLLRDVGEEYYDATAMAGYRWDGDEWWSLDTPRSVTDKAEFVATEGYGGAFFWDITGDFENELGGALAGTLRAATPGPLVPDGGAAPWYATGVYTAGDIVSHDGVEYRATWWTRDDTPGTGGRKDPWLAVGQHGDHPVEAEECAPAWSPDETYRRGDVVSRAGVNHVAMWWTRGDQPGTDPTSAWDAEVPCA
ncbi:glycosyl hydrolase family 18 protein [Myceligenerans salitolerans]|uniref:chitinase n=1 Tax=Myceligenerans salitolerans TaxID=1230528 RepID=A0ABS3IDR7_9MICO|nr:glycosyl hydrolase family 18 protein [Myceligenerans salitolerans]MBO0611093.1 chitinase [Myceligenerans salitolerans]